ncbi:MAG: major capsid protein [Microvirus sp.]|nr:MAG: major capsid protein [Microvirus sp.]
MNKRGEIFKTVSGGRKLRRNAFDLSHEKKLSANLSDLTPIYLQELVPGDRFRGSTEMIIKFAPLIAPVMHRINAYIHYFFVPNRLLWDNWQPFITGGTDGKSAPVFPYLLYKETNKQYFGVGSLPDYFGIPPIAQTDTIVGETKINALPFRAYKLIYNEYYRDQTLTPFVDIQKTDAEDIQLSEIAVMRKRQWEKDYFTSAQITSQRGDDVLIPMDANYKFPSEFVDATGAPLPGSGSIDMQAGGATVLNGALQGTIENIESLDATVNDLRTAIVLQQWLEKNMRAGARYVEQILAHFQRRVPDYRLQRPELIGGGKQTVMISEVLANFESAETAQGKMAGHGVSIGNQSGFKYTADEHGYIVGILSVLPRTCYMQGINRMFFKENKFDFYFPEFAHIGEQPIFGKEIYWDKGNVGNDTVFGYQSRFADYKYTPDSVHGEFRTNLEYWHLARKFANRPQLNHSFTECVPDTRIFAVQDEATQKLWIQLYNNIQAIRPMPVYGTPIL